MLCQSVLPDEETTNELNDVPLNEIFLIFLVFEQYIAQGVDQVLHSVLAELGVLQQ